VHSGVRTRARNPSFDQRSGHGPILKVSPLQPAGSYHRLSLLDRTGTTSRFQREHHHLFIVQRTITGSIRRWNRNRPRGGRVPPSWAENGSASPLESVGDAGGAVFELGDDLAMLSGGTARGIIQPVWSFLPPEHGPDDSESRRRTIHHKGLRTTKSHCRSPPSAFPSRERPLPNSLTMSSLKSALFPRWEQLRRGAEVVGSSEGRASDSHASPFFHDRKRG